MPIEGPEAATMPQVPQAPGAAQGGGDPFIGEIIKNINSPINPDLIRAATSLIAGPRQAQVPTNLQTPVQTAQAPLIPTQGIVGHGYGKKVGIGNAILGVTNALSSVVGAEAEHKKNQLKDAATKVITAQQGLDEAQQAHDVATKAGDTDAAAAYQKTIDENQKVIDGVFADPKLRKGLVKGFDISYTDPTANKTEEHQAVQEAMKSAKTMQEKREIMKAQQQKQQAAAGQAASKAFAEQQPRGLVENTQAQAQVQMQLEQNKYQQQVLKDYLTFKGQALRAGATVDAAKLREVGQSMMQKAKMDHDQDMLDQRFAQQKDMQGIKFSDELKAIAARGAEARETSRAIRQDKEADPMSIYEKTRKASETYSRNYMADLKTLNGLKNQRLSMYVDSKGKSLKPNENDVKNLDGQISLVQQQVQLDQQNATNFSKRANDISSMFGLKSGAEGGSDGDRNTNSSSDSSDDDSTNADDPSAYLN